jgi:DNA-binding response OmpR family regulator
MTVPAILFTGNNRVLTESIKDVLEMAGWHIELCDDGCMARALMENRKHYNLLLFDNEVRGISGLELTRRARQVPHLKQTPIILISVQDLADEALRAGANEFLRKPHNIVELLDTVRRLLNPPDKE